jgi:hypothetical protein
MSTHNNRTLPFAQRDLADALPEFFLSRAGRGAPQDPVAQELIERNVTLADLAAHFVGSYAGEANSNIISRAIGSADFGESLVTAFSRVAITAFDAAVSGYDRLAVRIPVPDFKPVRLPHLSGADFVEQPEHSEWIYSAPSTGVVLEGQAAVATQGTTAIITRQALLSDSAGQIAATAAEYGNTAALAIASAIASALSSTANLDDGEPLFSATATIANLVTAGGAPSVTTLSAGGVKLWRQPRAIGSVAGIAPAFMVIPPELFDSASTALIQTYGDINSARGNCDLVILPHLVSAAEWYLLGRPASAPVLGMLTLGSGSPLLVERVALPGGVDGIALRARLDFRIVRLSRLGAFKNDGA